MFKAIKKQVHTADIITGFRFVFSIALLFCTAFSSAFYVLYVLAGFSDMIDGAVARKRGTAGEFGSKLDSAADFVLVLVCLIKLIPVLSVPKWLLIWIIVIAAIKGINLISGFAMQKQLVVLHTVMNKATGLLLFVLPLTLTIVDLNYSGALVCAAASFAAIQEGHLIRTGNR